MRGLLGRRGAESTAGHGVGSRWRRVTGSYHFYPGPGERRAARTRGAAPSSSPLDSGVDPSGNRWYPVFAGTVGQVGDRVRALGGDPDVIKPSPEGEGPGEPDVGDCRTGRFARSSSIVSEPSRGL